LLLLLITVIIAQLPPIQIALAVQLVVICNATMTQRKQLNAACRPELEPGIMSSTTLAGAAAATSIDAVSPKNTLSPPPSPLPRKPRASGCSKPGA
jgi:hypothetical protein